MGRLKGLNLDYNESQIGQEQYRYALNMVQAEQDTMSNELGTDDSTPLPVTEDIALIGTIKLLDQKELLFFTDNTTSLVGVMDFRKETYTAIPNLVALGLDTALSLNKNYPVSGRFYIDDSNDCIVAFTDNFNSPKIMNIGALDGTYDIKDATDITDIEFFGDISAAIIQCSLSEFAGSVESGSYVIGYRYVDLDGTLSDVISLSNPIAVSAAPEYGVNTFEGLEGSSSSAIDISMTGVDTSKKALDLIAIRSSNSVTQVSIIKRINISSSTINYRYVGTELDTPFSLEETIAISSKFNKVKSIESLNNRLYFANVEEENDDNEALQGHANNVVMKWASEWVNVVGATETPISFQHGEVYAFYIRWKKANGDWTLPFHIAGRAEVAGDRTLLNDWGGELGRSEEKWQVEDTVIVETNNGTNGGISTGQMGFWENQNEAYPATGNFPTGNVRHHAMPSLAYLAENIYNDAVGDSTTTLGIDAMPQLKVFAQNVTIPAGYQSYEILYAKRTNANSKVQAVDLMPFMAFTDPAVTPNGEKWFRCNGLNINVDHQTYASRIADLSNNYSQMITLASQELLRNKPATGNLYVQTAIKLTLDRNQFGTYPAANELLKFTNEGTSILFDYTDQTQIANSTPNAKFSKFVSVLNDGKYIPTNATDVVGGEQVRNRFNTERFVANSNLSYDQMTYNFDTTVWNIDAENDTLSGDDIRFHGEVHLTEVLSYREDCYQGFSNQTLASAGKLQTTAISGYLQGDSYLSVTSINTCFSRNDLQWSTFERMAYAYVTCGRINFKYREEGSDPNSRYYPVTPFTDSSQQILDDVLNNLDATLDQNTWLYDSSFSQLNDYSQGVIWDEGLEFESKFPVRIYRSQLAEDETLGVNWKKFLPNDYYDMKREKGQIVNLQAYNDSLLIHQEEMLSRTRDNAQIRTDIASITVGSGDIFETVPSEIMPESRHAGTRHKHSCVMTPVGYAFPNSEFGKVFLYNGQLNEISASFTKKWFYERLPFKSQVVSSVTVTVPMYSADDFDDCNEKLRKIPFYYDSKDIYVNQGDVTLGNANSAVIEDFRLLDAFYIVAFEKEPTDEFIQLTGYEREEEVYYPDNPFAGEGYAIGYDEKYNRLLLTKVTTNQRVIGWHKGSPTIACEDLDYFDNEDLIVTDTGYRRILTEGIADEDGIVIVTCFGDVATEPPILCAILQETGFPNVILLEDGSGYIIQENCE